MNINFFNKKVPSFLEYLIFLIIPFIIFILLVSKNKNTIEEKAAQDQIEPTLSEKKLDQENNLIQLAIKQMVQKNYSESIKINLEVLKINENNKIAHNNLCYAYGEIEEYKKGITHCERAIALDPNFQLAKNNLNFLKRTLAKNNK